MDYLQTHILCHSSNWGGEYDCKHLVSIDSYHHNSSTDWDNIVDENADSFWSKDDYDLAKEVHGDSLTEEQLNKMATRLVPSLHQNSLEWLMSNVKDRQVGSYQSSVKGWCIGSVGYRSSNPYRLTVFFHRKQDALNFMKEFSVFEKPVCYNNRFTDIQKKLDLSTMRYVTV